MSMMMNPLLAMLLGGAPRNPDDELLQGNYAALRQPGAPPLSAEEEALYQSNITDEERQRMNRPQVQPIRPIDVPEIQRQQRLSDAINPAVSANAGWARRQLSPIGREQPPVEEDTETPAEKTARALAAMQARKASVVVTDVSAMPGANHDALAAKSRANSVSLAARRGALNPAAYDYYASEQGGNLLQPRTGIGDQALGAGHEASFWNNLRNGAFKGGTPDQIAEAYQTALKLDSAARLQNLLGQRQQQMQQSSQDAARQLEGVRQGGENLRSENLNRTHVTTNEATNKSNRERALIEAEAQVEAAKIGAGMREGTTRLATGQIKKQEWDKARQEYGLGAGDYAAWSADYDAKNGGGPPMPPAPGLDGAAPPASPLENPVMSSVLGAVGKLKPEQASMDALGEILAGNLARLNPAEQERLRQRLTELQFTSGMFDQAAKQTLPGATRFVLPQQGVGSSMNLLRFLSPQGYEPTPQERAKGYEQMVPYNAFLTLNKLNFPAQLMYGQTDAQYQKKKRLREALRRFGTPTAP